MTDRKRAGKHPDVNISIEGDVRGNIIVGNENIVQPPPNGGGIRPRWITAILLAVALAVAGGYAFLARSRLSLATPLTSSASATPLPLGVWQVGVFGKIDLSDAPLAVFALPAVAEEGGYRTRLTPAFVQQQVVLPSVYSLRLRGVFPFTEGEYAFHCLHDDGCRVYVDGENWIDAWWDGAGQHDLARPLVGGEHEVLVEFYDKGGVGNLEVWWERR